MLRFLNCSLGSQGLESLIFGTQRKNRIGGKESGFGPRGEAHQEVRHMGLEDGEGSVWRYRLGKLKVRGWESDRYLKSL